MEATRGQSPSTPLLVIEFQKSCIPYLEEERKWTDHNYVRSYYCLLTTSSGSIAKPCPFCGASPERCNFQIRSGTETKWWI